ncbi:MAG: hypothetical protein V6Z86_00130 [Hyphomicrobiales bacterium]
MAITAAMKEPVINLSDALYRLGATEVGKATGVDIAFMRPDFDSLDMLKQANLYWIGRSWDIETAPRIGKILREYFTQGMTREGLTARFAEDFAQMGDRSRRYWEVLADHTATKTREMGRVTGYRRAGIERVEVRAHLDERTTRICRHMHGRIIKVRRLADQRDAYLRAAANHDEGAANLARLERRESEVMDRLRAARGRLFDLALREIAKKSRKRANAPGSIPGLKGAPTP